MIESLMQNLSNLLRDSSIQQRRAATRTLMAKELASDWYRDFPGSVGARRVDGAIESGRGVQSWLDEHLNSLAYGISTLIRQHGAGGLRHSNLPSGKSVNDAEFSKRVTAATAWLQEAIAAMEIAGVNDKGVDATDDAFGSCGGSVSWL